MRKQLYYLRGNELYLKCSHGSHSVIARVSRNNRNSIAQRFIIIWYV